MAEFYLILAVTAGPQLCPKIEVSLAEVVNVGLFHMASCDKSNNLKHTFDWETRNEMKRHYQSSNLNPMQIENYNKINWNLRKHCFFFKLITSSVS